MNKKTKKFLKVYQIICTILFFVLFCFITIPRADIEEVSMFEFMSPVFISSLSFLISYFVVIIMHEVGHLLAGLLYKFEFLRFNILGLEIFKQKGKIKVKKVKVGIAGAMACVSLIPSDVPDVKKDKHKYVNFYLGGVFMQFILLIISSVLMVLTKNSVLFHALFVFSIFDFYVICNQLNPDVLLADLNSVCFIKRNPQNIKGIYYGLLINKKLYENKMEINDEEKILLKDIIDNCDDVYSDIAYMSLNHDVDIKRIVENKDLNVLYESYRTAYKNLKSEYNKEQILPYVMMIEILLDKNEYLKMYDSKYEKKLLKYLAERSLLLLSAYKRIISKNEEEASVYIQALETIFATTPVDKSEEKFYLECIKNKEK